ncbi:hypothetical protein H072_117 [Dactylellina haptotyla CBS 200.50]|uniref:Fungal N-terminal domain-containing protein n=1 Tax=Dactylellina haptotyla (strain CBS 200.50) TaxID=1284197 RepID=S8ARX0_DACHA|nr:hypothetical protein H072_117 [Dactylellina haptotyla CBS 200.50]
MSGLEVASAVVGILAIGGKMVAYLWDVSHKFADAPDSVLAALIALKETSLILEESQLYILQMYPVPENRRLLILIEHISDTLTGCVLTHSDLEKQIDFAKDTGSAEDEYTFDREKWLAREKQVQDAVRRLQDHKSSFALMLNILQW